VIRLRVLLLAAFGALALLAIVLGAQGEGLDGAAHVVDGDSLVVAGQKVRLYGIDAPEWNQICQRDGADWLAGRAAAAWLRRQAEGQTVHCVVEDEDRRYQRRVATCFLGKTELNRAIIQAGWAFAYRRYSDRYRADETAARAARRGVWQGVCDFPEAWRHAHPH